MVKPQTTMGAMATVGCTEKKSWTMWSKKLYFHIHCPTICTKEVQKGEAICIFKPTLEEIQSAINIAASHVLYSTKNVQNWNQKDQPEEHREPFYDWIDKDKEIKKIILILTDFIQGT